MTRASIRIRGSGGTVYGMPGFLKRIVEATR